MFSLCTFNIHIFVHSLFYISFSIFCDAVSSIFSPFLHTFHLRAPSRLQGIYWMDSPAIVVADLNPLDLRNQTQHCDVRHRHRTEIKNIHVLVCFDESTFFSVSYFEYCWTESCEFSLQLQYEICGRYYVYLPYKYSIHAVAYCNRTSICVCMYVCCMHACTTSHTTVNKNVTSANQLTSCRRILMDLTFQMLFLPYSKTLHLHVKTGYLMLSK
jgi:hypothetical protein